MNRRLSLVLVAASILAALLLGCSKHDLGVEPRFHLQKQGGVAKPDSQPHPTPPPHDTTVIEPIVFLSADSVRAGSSGVSHWTIGNRDRVPFTSTWVLTSQSGWPGYPIQGTVKLAPLKTAPLDVTFPVPASATSGIYLLWMTVTTATGDTYATYAYIRVYGNDPPPPPPPPPPAVVFFGSDSTLAGTSGNTTWQLTNESGHPFTMNWSLTATSGWPGFPIQGTVDLAPNASTLLPVSVPVPDTAFAGLHHLEMTVTRPDTLPPASAPGFIFVYH